MHGAPVFRGTRVPAQTLFDSLEPGDSLEEFLEGFPTAGRAWRFSVRICALGAFDATASR